MYRLAVLFVEFHKELHEKIAHGSYDRHDGKASDIGLLVAIYGFYATIVAVLGEMFLSVVLSGFEPTFAVATALASVSLIGVCFAIMKTSSPHRD